jgi:hypothetical protein
MFPLVVLKDVVYKFGKHHDVAVELFRRDWLERIYQVKAQEYDARL